MTGSTSAGPQRGEYGHGGHVATPLLPWAQKEHLGRNVLQQNSVPGRRNENRGTGLTLLSRPIVVPQGTDPDDTRVTNGDIEAECGKLVPSWSKMGPVAGVGGDIDGGGQAEAICGRELWMPVGTDRTDTGVWPVKAPAPNAPSCDRGRCVRTSDNSGVRKHEWGL